MVKRKNSESRRMHPLTGSGSSSTRKYPCGGSVKTKPNGKTK